MWRFWIVGCLFLIGCGEGPNSSSGGASPDGETISTSALAPEEIERREQIHKNFTAFYRDSVNLGARDFAMARRWYPYREGKVAIVRLTHLPPGAPQRSLVRLDDLHFDLPPELQARTPSEAITLAILFLNTTAISGLDGETEISSLRWYLWDLDRRVIIDWRDPGRDIVESICALPDKPPVPREPPTPKLQGHNPNINRAIKEADKRAAAGEGDEEDLPRVGE